MRQIVIVLGMFLFLFSCKEKEKTSVPDIDKVQETVQKEEPKKKEIQLPDNIVQLNNYELTGKGITITKAQIQHNKDDKYIYKIFFKSDIIGELQKGGYSIYVQNYPYEEDKEMLADSFKKKGIETYWINLKTSKSYKDEYVVFRSFTTNIESFEKTILGVLNTETKETIFKEEFEDSYISK